MFSCLFFFFNFFSLSDLIVRCFFFFFYYNELLRRGEVSRFWFVCFLLWLHYSAVMNVGARPCLFYFIFLYWCWVKHATSSNLGPLPFLFSLASCVVFISLPTFCPLALSLSCDLMRLFHICSWSHTHTHVPFPYWWSTKLTFSMVCVALQFFFPSFFFLCVDECMVVSPSHIFRCATANIIIVFFFLWKDKRTIAVEKGKKRSEGCSRGRREVEGRCTDFQCCRI